MKKVILIVVISVAVVATTIYWLVASTNQGDRGGLLTVPVLVLVVGLALALAFRRVRDLKQKVPPEDELSKKIMRRGAAASYYFSLYLWLVIMYFEEKIELERSSLIGAGIMGMAIIWTLSWLYHRFFWRPRE